MHGGEQHEALPGCGRKVLRRGDLHHLRLGHSQETWLDSSLTWFPFCLVFSLFSTHARKRKTLSWPESDAPEFVCVAFSSDSKYLLTQTGKSPSEKHDWTLIYWIWDKARYMASIKVSNPQNSLIRECSFNPTDSSIVCAAGWARG